LDLIKGYGIIIFIWSLVGNARTNLFNFWSLVMYVFTAREL
jgi:hypothetical protein